MAKHVRCSKGHVENPKEEPLDRQSVQGYSGEAIGPNYLTQSVLPTDYAKELYHIGYIKFERSITKGWFNKRRSGHCVLSQLERSTHFLPNYLMKIIQKHDKTEAYQKTNVAVSKKTSVWKEGRCPLEEKHIRYSSKKVVGKGHDAGGNDLLYSNTRHKMESSLRRGKPQNFRKEETAQTTTSTILQTEWHAKTGDVCRGFSGSKQMHRSVTTKILLLDMFVRCATRKHRLTQF